MDGRSKNKMAEEEPAKPAEERPTYIQGS